jgi:hypothetical protein
MKLKVYLLIILLIPLVLYSCSQKNWIRINQVGYRTTDIKVAVFLSKSPTDLRSFKVIDDASGKTIITSSSLVNSGELPPFKSTYRLMFSNLKKPGRYRIKTNKAVSPAFRIGDDVYNGTADFLLNYMRQQRCGFNPYIKDSCHTHDGYIIYGGKDDSIYIDVTGGWHDAADYLQYVATSANATYQMLFAFSGNPGSFTDHFQADGLPGRNGLPDVLDESKWGLDWLIKMNPSNGVMYNQIADDRDHIGFRLPDKDTADYGKGMERPVYRCTGKVQGVFKYKNRTTGIASTAGKFASAFARGSQVYRTINPAFSKLLAEKAAEAFKYGLENPGACQTAPGTAPYFYEEDNWTDDMELAAIELYELTGEVQYLNYAADFGRRETVTPWMGADTARHYQWYPFVNMGHPGVVSATHNPDLKNEFIKFLQEGLHRVKAKGEKNPFRIGVPFIWCSNNLVTAFLTQSHLYQEISGDTSFSQAEAAHRDWLFGCNPWGTSMVVGLPADGDYPYNTHSSYVVNGGQVPGGLVDGPVYPSIYSSLRYIYLSKKDMYSLFQTRMAVYHDDYADYSTNECTMDGTACLIYYLSALEKDSGEKNKK